MLGNEISRRMLQRGAIADMSGFESSQHDTVGFSEKLTKARNGSSDEQAAMLETFRDYLRKIASKTISDNAQAQLSVSDLVQSAIIDAHKSFASCRATNSVEFKAWIRQILLNDILNRHRNLRRQKRDIRKEKQLSGRYLVEDIDSPSEQVIRQEDEAMQIHSIFQAQSSPFPTC